MAVKFLSVSAITCDRVLQEADGIVSAIRIVDIFNVASPPISPPTIQLAVILILKGMPSSEKFRLGVALINVSGERKQLADPPNQPYSFPVFGDDPTIPTSLSFVLQFTIEIKRFGTAYIEFSVDGVEIARVPFTTRSVGPAQPASLTN